MLNICSSYVSEEHGFVYTANVLFHYLFQEAFNGSCQLFTSTSLYTEITKIQALGLFCTVIQLKIHSGLFWMYITCSQER